MTEHEEQTLLVAWFRKHYPQHLLAAIPNGGKRNITTAIKLKAEGVLPGMPDLFIAAPKMPYSGLFIEMKGRAGAKVSNAQRAVISDLNAIGYKAVVCYGADEAKDAINAYFS